MNLKSIVTGAAIAATLVAGGVATTAPAHAGDLKFGGTARVKQANVAIGANSIFDFSGFNPGIFVGTGTGTVLLGSDPIFGVAGSSITLKDFQIQKTSATTWTLLAPVNNFITGLAGATTYTLNSFSLTRGSVGPLTVFAAAYTGVFNNLPGGIGLVSSGDLAIAGGAGAGFNSTVTGPATAIPTPALLPGLLGLGVAALRKRKGEGSEAEKETVGVKA